MKNPSCWFIVNDLGKVSYSDALDIQYNLVARRKENKIPDTILFLDHYNVYTIGRKSDPENYKNVDVIKTDRGGDVTNFSKVSPVISHAFLLHPSNPPIQLGVDGWSGINHLWKALIQPQG